LDHPVSEGYKYGDLALQAGEVSNLRQQNMVMSPVGLGPENDCAGEDQQQLETTDPSSHQRGCYIRTITASVHLKQLLVVSLKGLVAKADWRKPPVIK
jgi:hypothetical protein